MAQYDLVIKSGAIIDGIQRPVITEPPETHGMRWS